MGNIEHGPRKHYSFIASGKLRPRHRPTRSYNEMAAEFGLTTGQLTSLVKRYGGFPMPRLVTKSFVSGVVEWHDPILVRAWWQDVQAQPGFRSPVRVSRANK